MLNVFVTGAQSLIQTLVFAATVPFAPVSAPALVEFTPTFSSFSTEASPSLPAAPFAAISAPTPVGHTVATSRAVAKAERTPAKRTAAKSTAAKRTSAAAPIAPPVAAYPQQPAMAATRLAEVKAPSVNEVVARLQKTYERTTAFRANFTQRYTSTLLKTTSESSGTVAFKKPGLMRWDYAAPSTKSFVIDGERLWIYQPEDNLAMVDHCFKQDGLTASVRFLWGAGDIQKDFNVSAFGGVFGKKTDHHLLLTPKTPNGIFLKLILVVDPKSYRVKQSVVVDNQGNVNQFMFEGLNFKPGLKTADFAMNLPKTTAVSRMPGTCNPAIKPSK